MFNLRFAGRVVSSPDYCALVVLSEALTQLGMSWQIWSGHHLKSSWTAPADRTLAESLALRVAQIHMNPTHAH